MSSLHKALYLWTWSLVFLILLCLQLDEKVNWNWFLIFIPMWILDVSLILFNCVPLFRCIRDRQMFEATNGPNAIQRMTWTFSFIFMKLAFQALLCLRLNGLEEMRLVYVMIPAWIGLLGINIDFLYRLIVMYGSRSGE